MTTERIGRPLLEAMFQMRKAVKEMDLTYDRSSIHDVAKSAKLLMAAIIDALAPPADWRFVASESDAIALTICALAQSYYVDIRAIEQTVIEAEREGPE